MVLDTNTTTKPRDLNSLRLSKARSLALQEFGGARCPTAAVQEALTLIQWVAQGQMVFVHDKYSMVDVVAGL